MNDKLVIGNYAFSQGATYLREALKKIEIRLRKDESWMSDGITLSDSMISGAHEDLMAEDQYNKIALLEYNNILSTLFRGRTEQSIPFHPGQINRKYVARGMCLDYENDAHLGNRVELTPSGKGGVILEPVSLKLPRNEVERSAYFDNLDDTIVRLAYNDEHHGCPCCGSYNLEATGVNLEFTLTTEAGIIESVSSRAKGMYSTLLKLEDMITDNLLFDARSGGEAITYGTSVSMPKKRRTFVDFIGAIAKVRTSEEAFSLGDLLGEEAIILPNLNVVKVNNSHEENPASYGIQDVKVVFEYTGDDELHGLRRELQILTDEWEASNNDPTSQANHSAYEQRKWERRLRKGRLHEVVQEALAPIFGVEPVLWPEFLLKP